MGREVRGRLLLSLQEGVLLSSSPHYVWRRGGGVGWQRRGVLDEDGVLPVGREGLVLPGAAADGEGGGGGGGRGGVRVGRGKFANCKR